ncbi:MAG: leucine-rich repeat protein, partial [Ruthenibacterium sp.]
MPQEGAVPPAPAASDSTAASSGSETLVPENNILTPADSGVTQQLPNPRKGPNETTWNIGFPTETDLTATLSADETTLTIAGTGRMKDFSTNATSRPPWFSSNNSIRTVTISQGVTSIGNYAFAYLKALPSVVIPTGVTSIGCYAFDGCSNLKSAMISEGVTFIGEGAFRRCSLLQSITIPVGVTSIGSMVFNECGSLTSVVIPAGVTDIGNYAFADCLQLQTATIPAGVTRIRNGVFQNCKALGTITLPASVKAIDDRVFLNCTALTQVTALAIESIGANAFDGCAGLNALTLPATPPAVYADAFIGCPAARNISIVNAQGAPLPKDNPLYAAQATYDADDSPRDDGMWYGWKVREPMTKPAAEWTPTGGKIACGRFLAAIESMKAKGGSIKLLTKLLTTDSFVLPATSIVLDLNGGLWTKIATTEAVSVPSGGVFTVTDSGNGGTIDGGGYDIGIEVLEGGTFALQSGSIVALDTGRYDGIFNEGTVKLSGGTVSSAKAYAVNNAGGTLYLSGTPTFNSKTGDADIANNGGVTIVANDGAASNPAYFTGTASIRLNNGAKVNDVAVSGVKDATQAKKFTFENVPATLKTVYSDTDKSIRLAATATVTSVTVTPTTATVQKGGTQQFTAKVNGKGGPAQDVTWTVTGGGAGTSISKDGLLSVAANESAAKVTVKATSDANKKISGTAVVTVTLKPATLTINSVTSKTYDGKAMQNPTDITSNLKNPTVTYTYYKNANDKKGEALASAPKDAGTYWVEGAIAATATTSAVTSNAVKFTISKADQAALTFDAIQKTYGDAAFTPAANGGSGDGAITYQSAKTSVISISGTQATICGAGTATLTATKAGGNNYNDKSIDAVVTVSPATPIISWNGAQTLTYTGKDAAIDAPTITGVTGGTAPTTAIVYSYKTSGTEYKNGLPKEVGTYSVKAEIAAEGNYTAAKSTADMSLTIRKATQPTTISDFVEQLYKTILGRGSDAAGRKTWVDGLTNKTISGASCVYSFVFGTEYLGQNTSDDDFITMLYAAFFGRKPDESGYKTWQNALENGMSREWVFTHFVSSSEFAGTCKALGIEV